MAADGSNINSSDILDSLLVQTVFQQNINNIRQMLLKVCEVCAYYLPADAGSIFLRKGDTLHRAVVLNRSPELLSHLTIRIDEGLGGYVFQERRTVILNNVADDIRAIHREWLKKEGIVGYIGQPLFYKNNIIGVMYYFRKEKTPFTAAAGKQIELFATLLEMAMESSVVAPALHEKWLKLFQIYIDRLTSASMQNTLVRLRPMWVFSSDLPKGIHPDTLNRVQQFMHYRPEPVDSDRIAEELGLSLTSTRRYLNYLYEIKLVEKEVIYKQVGRPSYKWKMK